MKMLLVDDERSALSLLEKSVGAVCPEAELFCCRNAAEALEAAKTNTFDIAFLDIQMGAKNGVVLGKELKDITPEVNLVFCTAYSEYAMDAFRLHASGYLLKPISEDAIRAELAALRTPVEVKPQKRIYIQTFGNFDVFCDGKPVPFIRSKSKEILAYLVDCRGTAATSGEIAAILWENEPFDRVKQKQLQTYISDLRKSLKAVGAEEIVIRNANGLMLNKSLVDCDFYRLVDGDAAALNQYSGKYMDNYSWAELTAGFLDGIYN